MSSHAAWSIGFALLILACLLMHFDRVIVGYRVPGWYISLVLVVSMAGAALCVLPLPFIKE